MKAWISLWAAVLAVLAISAGGCGVAGDSTSGEENRSRWRIDDGLCPGAEGGCAMTVPVAARVELSVDAEVLCAIPERDSSGEYHADCDLSEFDVAIAGAAELRSQSQDASAGRIDLRVYATATGQAALVIRRSGGSFDRVMMEVREAADIQCGKVGADGASWDMHSLGTSESYAVELYGADADPEVELGCRLVDASGNPLFSAAAIEWQIIEGADNATVDDGGLFGTDASTGARVYVHVNRSGTVRLEAHFEGLTRQIELVAG
jgi:hypothetical protein